MPDILKTFRFRLFLSYLALSAVVLGVAFFLVYQRIERAEISALRAKLSDEAALVSAQLRSSDLSSPGINALAHSLGSKVRSRLTIIDADGWVLADSELDGAAVKAMENHSGRPEVVGALEGAASYDLRHSATLGKVMLYAAYPVISGGRVGAVARLAVPAAQLESARAMLKKALLAALTLALLLSFFLSLTVSAGLARPFDKIVYGSKKFAAGDFSYRIQKDFHGEMGKLAETLNSMSAAVEENLRRVETQAQQLAAAFANMAEGVLVTDMSARVTALNPSVERIFSIKAGDAITRPLLEVIPNAGLSGICARALSGGKPASEEMELTTPVRGVFSVNAVPIFEGGAVSGCLMVVHDITEVRRLEAKRRDFVANVSHELKTPLTAIRGYVETLMGGAIDDKEHAMEFLGVILQQSRRLDNIISDLLKLSSLESYALEVKKEELGLKDLADSLIAGLASIFKAKNAAVYNTIPAGLVVRADPEKLGQVFINLLDNAVKFSTENAKVEVSVQELPGSVKVVVKDSGIGIPQEHLAWVFERFYRVDKARSREMGGTGLGLSIVKHVVELHGGLVGVESAEGRGSTFWFTLPK
ncbi:MAG TPA: PAS domain-containing sensor histidine kinase [Elusimicrobia bacterium]|nr:PAS domain-containing sensor histidine kinase [Elusimicrobiota bacterium]